MKYLIILLFSGTSFIALTQGVEGIWLTYDEKSGELNSEVEIYIKDNKLFGKILQIYNSNEENAKCIHCKDHRKDQPIKGLVFMSGLKKSGKEWVGDKALLDPDNGKEYDGRVWLINNDKLAVRGYLGWVYSTKYWKRKK